MKRMKCEVCGNTDIIKVDDFFKCQACGCKYSLEQVQKLMVELSGTVEVSNIANVENLIKKGFMELDTQDVLNAKNTFKKALELCPTDIRVLTGLMIVDDSKYYYGKMVSIEPEMTKLEKQIIDGSRVKSKFIYAYFVNNDIKRMEYVLMFKQELYLDGVLEAAVKSNDKVVVGMMLKAGAKPVVSYMNAAVNNNNTEIVKMFLQAGAKPVTSDMNAAVENNNIEIVKMFLQAGADISGHMSKNTGFAIYPDGGAGKIYQAHPLELAAFRGRVEILELLLQNGGNPNRVHKRYQKSYRDGEQDFTYDSLIKLAKTSETKAVIKKYGGGKFCYIATAVYGSYEAPEVLTLRTFRDEVLEQSLWGRLFIKIYYAISPPIAEWLKGATKTNLFVKKILDGWVEKLSWRE